MRTMTREKTLMWDVPAKWGSVDGALLQMQCGGLKAKIYEWMCHCNALGTSLQWNPLVIAQTMGTKYPEQEGIGIWIPPQKTADHFESKRVSLRTSDHGENSQDFWAEFLRIPPVCTFAHATRVRHLCMCASGRYAHLCTSTTCTNTQEVGVRAWTKGPCIKLVSNNRSIQHMHIWVH